jgi:aminoglycoside phosphotransferase (APT) family kinase protein
VSRPAERFGRCGPLWSDAGVLTLDDGVDVAPALEWATGHVGRIARVRQLLGGWTSTMMALRTERGDEVVLRLMTKEPWRSHGAELTAREHEAQRMLVEAAVPAPRPIALDADGRHCGFPAHLMTLLPGTVELDRVDDTSLTRLAHLLHSVHEIQPRQEVRSYQSWAWEAKYVVPAWATDPVAWREAFALLRGEPPAYQARFLHRDFQMRNVLWSGSRPSGVVDWVETSMGPAWLDVAHCSTNIAIRHGSDRADAFAAAYLAVATVEPQPFYDVMDIVGFLPPPGKREFLTDADERSRLEARLQVVLSRL